MNEQSIEQFIQAPTSQSVRLIDFEVATITIKRTVPLTYFLVVTGTKPYLNMTVRLSPLVYVRQPEYWGIEVLGSLPGIALPGTESYIVAIPLNGIFGTTGIEVIGARSSQKIEVPGGFYTFTDLGTLGGTFSEALAINNAGQVAGRASTTGSSPTHATLWNGTTATDLGTLGGNRGEAFAINNAGQVAGWSQTTGLETHATLWNGATATDLGTLGGTFSEALAINNAGQVAGRSQTTGSLTPHATLWNGTTATDLGTLGGTNSQANAINNAGQVAGRATTADGETHATLWNGITATDLGTLGGTSSEALAINNAGQVAGWATTAGGETHATLWNGITATDLGTLGGTSSEALAINNAGQVAGWATAAGGETRATLWNGTTATDLNNFLDAGTVSAGWVLIRATGINDNGWIVGEAGNTPLGVTHAFLLTEIGPTDSTPRR